MSSKWFDKKEEALRLRRRGLSIRKIEHRLGIPRSTLSGWFKNIVLSKKQRNKLFREWKQALIKARKKAVLWHNGQKRQRVEEARRQAAYVLGNLNVDDRFQLELALAILYLGEGGKVAEDTSLGSSDPLILKFFITCLKKLYSFDIRKIRCFLHLRADQNQEKMKRYWSRELGVSRKNFKKVSIDKRTIGSKTYPHYKGVCVLYCGHVGIKRRLLYLSRMYCQKVMDDADGIR